VLDLLAALALLATALYTLRGGVIGPGRGLQVVGFDTNAIGLGVVAVAAAVWFFGWQYGAALIITVVIHEFGHVAAFRICGHSDARFRLIPLFGGAAISGKLPASHENDLFISLMGPAICLAPMVLCFALSDVVVQSAWGAANFLYILGLVMGSLNFFNLLPFWPLDGGKITRVLTYTYMPGATRAVSIAMSATAAALCVLSGSFFLLVFVLMGWPGLMQSEQLIRMQRPMSKTRGLWAAAAYFSTLLAFGVAGLPLLRGFI
jgi:Zn-dependent protease